MVKCRRHRHQFTCSSQQQYAHGRHPNCSPRPSSPFGTINKQGEHSCGGVTQRLPSPLCHGNTRMEWHVVMSPTARPSRIEYCRDNAHIGIEEWRHCQAARTVFTHYPGSVATVEAQSSGRNASVASCLAGAVLHIVCTPVRVTPRNMSLMPGINTPVMPEVLWSSRHAK